MATDSVTKEKSLPSIAELKALTKKIDTLQTNATYSGFSIDRIRNAIFRMRDGDFSEIAELYQAMSLDDGFTSVVNKRINALLYSDQKFVPKYPDDLINKEISEQVGKIFYEGINDQALKTFYENYILFGISVGFVSWETVDGVHIPTLNNLDIGQLRYNKQDGKLYYQTRYGQREEITPDDGNYILLSDWEYGESTGVVPSLAMLWFFKQLLQRDAGDAMQGQADPIVVISEDKTQETPLREDENDMLLYQIQLQKKERVLYLDGKEIQVVDTSGSFDPAKVLQWIQYLNQRYAIALLGSHLSTELTSGGSYAAAKTHQGAELQLVQSDASILSKVLSKQLLYYITLFNFLTRELETSIEWVIKPDVDISQYAASLKTFMEFASMELPGYKIANLEELATKFGIELERE